MFSAFKKLANRSDTPGSQNGTGTSISPGGVQSMAHNLQKKFSKGCNYNMKIVIRGDKNTGKSCLLTRLQGGVFKDEYSPTDEIQVASINWSYKNTDDIVKVEVWDVVDVAKKRKKLTGLKMGPGAESETFEPGLDAQFLDVYKQAHGVIIIFDITKPWTFDYTKKELDNVPSNIPVLVLANFCDASHHRQVTKLQVADFIENFQRKGTDPAQVRWAESSLRNGFGLKFLHKFFNVPFLTLQRQSLQQQLEQNTREIQATQDELDLYMESDDADYGMFSQGLTVRRRLAAEEVAPLATRSIVVGQASNRVEISAESSTDITYSNRSNPTTEKPNKPSPQPSPEVPTTLRKDMSPAKPGKLDVENFVPDTGDFDTFLEEENSTSNQGTNRVNGNLDSSDDEGDGNPMVSKFAEDVDLEEYQPVPDIEIDPVLVQEENKPRVKAKSKKKDVIISDLEPSSVEEVKLGELDLDDFLGEVESSVEISHSTHDGYDEF